MKKLTLFCILTFVISQLVSAQEYGWTDISANIPTEADLSDLFFISDNEGWITSSSNAEIYHTTDGAETFEIQTTQYYCNALYMNDASEGYAGGENGRVYRTTDGGDNWIAIGSIGVTLSDIDFTTPIQGYCCGDNGTVFSITPSGVTNLNSGLSTELAGIASPSSDNVWVCGGATISYYNGTSFTFQSGPAGTYNEIFFLNDQEGWIVGNNGVIGHTENGGENWYSQINPDNNSLYKVFFFNETKGWAVGAQGTIIKTTNGSETWLLDQEGSTLAGTKFLRGVHFTSSSNGYIVGNDKTLLKYTQVSGIEEEALAIEFELFPNPVHENLYIKCSDLKTDKGTIQILSIDGKEILKTEIRQGNESIEIDLAKLEAGMYLCKMNIGNRSSTKKIIIE